MPCDSVVSVTVEFGAKTSVALLTAALNALGLSARTDARQPHIVRFGANEFIDTRTGQAQLAWDRNVGEIKRAYSAEVVKSQAKRFGWQLKETGAYQYEILKR